MLFVYFLELTLSGRTSSGRGKNVTPLDSVFFFLFDVDAAPAVDSSCDVNGDVVSAASQDIDEGFCNGFPSSCLIFFTTAKFPL